MKKILSLILTLTMAASVSAADVNWKLHPIFDEEVNHVVETPDYVYFTSRQMMENSSNEVLFSLFRYDKKGEEMMPLSSSNILNGHNVRDVAYNPQKGYLAIIYKDYDIDLLHNNGKVTNIPYYAQSSISYPKKVNSISVDPDNDRLYLSTDFGYVAINDKKNEVAESRIYGVPFQSFIRMGDKVVALYGDEVIAAEASAPRLSIDQYETLGTFNSPVSLLPLNSNQCVIIMQGEENKTVKLLTVNGNNLDEKDLITGNFHNIDNTSNGPVLATDNILYQIKNDGSVVSVERPADYRNCAAVSTNMTEIWNGLKRKGLSSVKKNGESWNVTRNWMLPNAPATYVSYSFLNHPSRGFMMLDYGYNPSTMQLDSWSPYQLSAYKNGKWTNLAPAYTDPELTTIMSATNGIVTDPDNENYIYVSSYHNGFYRLNLSNPRDVIQFARIGDGNNRLSWFVPLDFLQDSQFANISAPYYDKRGNLWMLYNKGDDPDEPNPHYICWTAEERKATTSAANARVPHSVEFDMYSPATNFALSIPLMYSGNGRHVFVSRDESRNYLAVFDTNGTPVDTNDDKIYEFSSIVDSDGNDLSFGWVNYLWEDPSTGYVWICHANGVCYFSPSQAVSGNRVVTRVKVPRNDGTNLADYLLDGVGVNHMTTDSEGRKWFATKGGGVVCTSADGREILEEFNTSNSPLPDDLVYGIGYNAADNSLLISTDQGYVEYLLPANQEASNKTDIKAYPNPVRPEFTGYVTITDIPQGSFVKITDSAGNLVKELGIMTGFDILWDLSDTNFNRVKSGVYHIMVSPGSESGSFSGVGKILVIS